MAKYRDMTKRLIRRYREASPPEPESAADVIAEAIGLAPDDPLVAVLSPVWAHATLTQAIVEAGEDPGPRYDPTGVLEAIGVGVQATGDDILKAARVGLKRSPAGFRARVLEAARSS